MSEPGHQDTAGFIEPFRVKPGATVTLARDFDPGFTAGLKKADGIELLAAGVENLSDLQARLAAQDSHGLLVVLQALDAGGKDGTIKHVLSGVNPQGVEVHSFKVPSAEELSHDYLWRYQRRLPARGQIAIFNRSHYEEVLVVRVHPENLDRQHMPPRAGDVWKRRYREINHWEHYLVDNGITVVKLFLNLSYEQQRRRLLRRTDLPDHNWKFSMADVEERKHWDEYQLAFSEMLSHTSTEWAPWHVIPADHKWFARAAASSVIQAALETIDPQFPTLDADGLEHLAQARAALEAQAPAGG